MPAYNPPPQVLFSPVTNYYQGKAIRQGLEEQKVDTEIKRKQSELLTQEIADAPSKREAARQKALLDAENIRSSIDERYAKGEREKLKYADEVMKPLFAAYGAEKDEDKALEIFNIGLPEAISRLPEDEQQKFAKMDSDKNGRYDHDEIMRAGYARRYVEEKENSYSVVSLDEKLAMGMPKEWAENAVVEKDQDGNLSFNNRPTGMTEGDLALRGDPRTPTHISAAFAKAKESFDGSSDIREEIGDFIPRARALPDAVGGMARLTQVVAAALEMFGADATADQIASLMSDTDQETLASMAAQMKLIRGRIRPLVTGDRGARQSDKELEISNRTLALTEQIESPVDLLRNYPQVMGGMKELYVATLVNQYNQASHTEGLDFPYDLSSPSEVEELSATMTYQGISDEDQIRFLLRLSKIQGVTLQ